MEIIDVAWPTQFLEEDYEISMDRGDDRGDRSSYERYVEGRWEMEEKPMIIFLICPVRLVEHHPSLGEKTRQYVGKLEEMGYEVYWPARDTDQTNRGLEICDDNATGIDLSDVVHVWWDPRSEGSKYDLGVARALRKPIIIANKGIVKALAEQHGGKCFEQLLLDWEEETASRINLWVDPEDSRVTVEVGDNEGRGKYE